MKSEKLFPWDRVSLLKALAERESVGKLKLLSWCTNTAGRQGQWTLCLVQKWVARATQSRNQEGVLERWYWYGHSHATTANGRSAAAKEFAALRERVLETVRRLTDEMGGK